MRQYLGLMLICGASLWLLGCGGGSYSELAEQSAAELEAAENAAQAATEREAREEATRTNRAAESISLDSNAAETPMREPVAPPAVEPAAPPASPSRSDRAPAPRVVTAVLGARNRNTALSNGKQIGLAMLQNDRFPAQATVSAEGTPLLSWRVKLMQTLDRNLYNAFNHDVAWDHPDNLPLIDQMPSIFDSGYPLENGHTVFMVVTGDDTMFPDPSKSKRGLKMGQCSDGASKTVLFVVANPSLAVPWTKPQDIVFDPANPSAGLAGPDDTIIAGFCDGSMRRLSGLDDATVKAVLTRRGGEVVGSLD